MTRHARLIMFAIGGVVLLTLLWQTAGNMYFKPRAELLRSIERAQADIKTFQSKLDGQTRIQRDLRAVAARTLGDNVESVDHRLRSRLNRIAEDVGLSGATVGTSAPSTRPSPARAMFRGAGSLMRDMRDMIDFTELEGSISGEGTLEEVIALIDRIEAEPWIKRINSVRIEPRSAGAVRTERFAVMVRLSTIFLPGVPPDDPGAMLASAMYDESRLARFASLLETNPFSIPQASPPLARHAPGPPAFSYGEWVLTGIAESGSGVEAWLLNRISGEHRVLAAGQRLEDAVFVAANSAGDAAEFQIGERMFLVPIGGHLAGLPKSD